MLEESDNIRARNQIERKNYRRSFFKLQRKISSSPKIFNHFTCHPLTRVSLNTFRAPVHFPIFPEGGRVARFRPEGGLGCKVFGREAPENGAEGAVLESFSDFSKIVA